MTANEIASAFADTDLKIRMGDSYLSSCSKCRFFRHFYADTLTNNGTCITYICEVCNSIGYRHPYYFAYGSHECSLIPQEIYDRFHTLSEMIKAHG